MTEAELHHGKMSCRLRRLLLKADVPEDELVWFNNAMMDTLLIAERTEESVLRGEDEEKSISEVTRQWRHEVEDIVKIGETESEKWCRHAEDLRTRYVENETDKEAHGIVSIPQSVAAGVRKLCGELIMQRAGLSGSDREDEIDLSRHLEVLAYFLYQGAA